jgi:hypothetical protein
MVSSMLVFTGVVCGTNFLKAGNPLRVGYGPHVLSASNAGDLFRYGA